MTLQKKILRSVRKNLSFYITGTVLTALTIMLWVGAFAVSDTMTETYTKFFAEENAEDGQFTVSEELSNEDITETEQKFGIQIEKQTYLNIGGDDGTKLRMLSDGEKINRTKVLSGRGLQSDGDVLISYNYAKAHSIKEGDTVTLGGKEYTVCGLCVRPDYAMMYAEFADSFPDSESFGLAVVTKKAIDSTEGISSYYSVKYDNSSNESSARGYLYDKYGLLEYIPQSANPRMGTVLSDAKDLKAEFSVYSPIIMLVVIAVIAMVLRRTVKRESKTIGVLISLGYNKQELVRHYMFYALIPAVLGDIMGLICCVPFSRLFGVYLMSFAEHIDYGIKMPWGIVVMALLIPLAVYSLTAFMVLSGSLNSDAVTLLKGIKSGRISHVLKNSNINFKWLYNIRIVLANVSRSLTLLVGIAAATMAVVLSGVYQDAYDDMLENKVPMAMMGGKYEYGFTEFQQDNNYGGNAVIDVSFGVKGTDSMFNLVGIDEGCELFDPKTLSGKPFIYGGYYMTSSAARIFGVNAGDSFTFYNIVSMKSTTVHIDDILDNDVLPLIITSKANEAEILGRQPNEFNVIISGTPLDIPQELLNKSASLEDYRRSTENALKTAEIVLNIVKVIGALICVLVVMMLAGMIVEENRRNISMLEVLGYRKAEIRSMILSSNHLIVPFGLLLGTPLGVALSAMIAENNAKASGIMMSIALSAKTFFISLIFVAVAYIVSLLLAGRKLKNVDMVECLKESRE
ncbi:MAG: ABC transporter permease [Ruminococcus sp.]|nr:ABC transporter permease [Ruminococcus sp.]